MIWLLKWLIWGPPPKPLPPPPPEPSCKEGGPHRYFARYDDMLDPRLTSDQVEDMFRSQLASNYGVLRDGLLTKIYVKDICSGCGDVIERLEGLNGMEVLAHQAKRIS
jgi:hypothetical protein